MCEVDGNPKLCKACATEIAPGMIVNTNTDRVIESRKTNLELLLSNHTGDCRPPCVLACPAHTDCQGYVGLIANGEFEAALELVKDKIPLPAALGRVCPHPCEEACRRGLVDEPISIQQLKRFAADQDLDGDRFIPECDEECCHHRRRPDGLIRGILLKTDGTQSHRIRIHAEGRRYAPLRYSGIQTSKGCLR